MTLFHETGWAKINLALHVRARRADGYHEIETLFAFVDGGDAIAGAVSYADDLTIDGPFGDGLSAGADNLVLRVLARARLVRAHFLPDVGEAAIARLVGTLGADVAACVASATCLGVGTGAELSPVPELTLGGTPVLLVNPRAPVATGPVFAAWDGTDRGPLFTGADLRAQLFAARNDLQRPAIAQCPAIADILTELGGLGPWLARMSGSGATCFALFDAPAERDAAATELAVRHPGWWQMAGALR